MKVEIFYIIINEKMSKKVPKFTEGWLKVPKISEIRNGQKCSLSVNIKIATIERPGRILRQPGYSFLINISGFITKLFNKTIESESSKSVLQLPRPK